MSSITARSLNAALRAAGEAAEEITGGCLNYGGCCVFAAIVGRQLQGLGITVGAVVRGWGARSNVRDVRANIREVEDGGQWNSNGIHFNHVGLEYVINGRAYHYDSEALTGADRHPKLQDPYPGRLTVEEVEALASRPSNWNRSFDRALIPRLEAAVVEAFGSLRLAPAKRSFWLS